MRKICCPDANKRPKTTPWKECTYVKKYINESDDTFDSPPDNEITFSSSYFNEETIVNLETTEENLKEMNLYRVQEKRDKLLSQKYDRDGKLQYKKRIERLPKITSPSMM